MPIRARLTRSAQPPGTPAIGSKRQSPNLAIHCYKAGCGKWCQLWLLRIGGDFRPTHILSPKEKLRGSGNDLGNEDPLPDCTGAFTSSQGLPCAHMLKTLQEEDQILLLDHFHLHWHLKREGAPQLMLEPLRHIDRISRNSRIPQQSTQREPSGFEAVERAAALRAEPKCSKCGAFGHIRT